jgi:hypothetical protein
MALVCKVLRRQLYIYQDIKLILGGDVMLTCSVNCMAKVDIEVVTSQVFPCYSLLQGLPVSQRYVITYEGLSIIFRTDTVKS